MKQKKLEKFDPNSAATSDGIFGLPFSEKDSKVVILSVPFEATTSYLGGTSKAPARILEASHQVDLLHPTYGNAWEKGIHLLPLKNSAKILNLSKQTQKLVKKSRGTQREKEKDKLLRSVNQAGSQLNDFVSKFSAAALKAGKIPVVLGGDHSVPFGNIAECVRHFPKMGVLHLDAHFDLRRAYEGFTWSHASIFQNVITRLPLQRLVQIGIRDFCVEELDFAQTKPQIRFFTDKDLFTQKSKGKVWDRLCEEIIENLPQEVYLSFDIDGLDPAFCPKTGTPVPGGLSFNEITYLIQKVVESKRKIVGFDLVEVGPDEWDANVGARLLYTMACAAIESQT